MPSACTTSAKVERPRLHQSSSLCFHCLRLVSVGCLGVQYLPFLPLQACSPMIVYLWFFFAIRLYLGCSKEGIRDVLDNSWECAEICRELELSSLAPMETAILKLAATIPHKEQGSLLETMLFPNSCRPATGTLARGIVTYLDRIHQRDQELGYTVAKAATPDYDFRWDVETGKVDAFANTDFQCKICLQELSNSYLHCQGCLDIDKYDYNICLSCYQEGRFYSRHVGREKNDQRKCKCTKTAKLCSNCGLCTVHRACLCHANFIHHYRFYLDSAYTQFVANCKSWGVP